MLKTEFKNPPTALELVQIGIVRNPTSGRGRSSGAWVKAQERLRAAFPNLRIEETYAAGSARQQAQKLAQKGCTIVVAAGGDGTIRDVMEGVLGTSAALGVLPLGTGNDFARSLGIGTNVDLAVSTLIAGHVKRIDVGRWTRNGEQGHFVNVAGCGFDAVVADRVNRGIKHLNGKWAYVAAIFSTLCSFKASRLVIQVDGETLDTNAMLCAFANARSYGGGMVFAPMADLSDGLLDLVLVQELSRTEFLRVFPKVFKGGHMSHPKVLHRSFRTLTIDPGPEVLFLMDGEVLQPGLLKIEVVPAALDVIVPAILKEN